MRAMSMSAPQPRLPRVSRPALPVAARHLAVTLLLTAIVAVAVPIGVAQEAQEAQQEPQAEPAPAASPRDGQQIQDWTLRCAQPSPDQPEVCEMFQRQVDEQGNEVLRAVIGKLPNNPNPGFLIILPLGISLPAGTFVRIDDGKEVAVPVERCVAHGFQGCRVELLLDPDLMALLKRGRQATVGFHAYDREGQVQRVDVPISLLGFTAALAEVTK